MRPSYEDLHSQQLLNQMPHAAVSALSYLCAKKQTCRLQWLPSLSLHSWVRYLCVGNSMCHRPVSSVRAADISGATTVQTHSKRLLTCLGAAKTQTGSGNWGSHPHEGTSHPACSKLHQQRSQANAYRVTAPSIISCISASL